MNHSRCVCNKLKIQLSSVKTQLYYLVKYPHVLVNVSSYHQTDPKNIKRKKEIIHFQYWSDISDFTNVLFKVYNIHDKLIGRIK